MMGVAAAMVKEVKVKVKVKVKHAVVFVAVVNRMDSLQ
jgi:hypothetical protein